LTFHSFLQLCVEWSCNLTFLFTLFLPTLWIEVLWVNYGPFGRLHRRDGFLVPLNKPEPINANTAAWRQGDRCQVLPIGTHLLGVLDEPQEVLRRYAGHLETGRDSQSDPLLG
jgi:hypothetical protein